MPGMVPQGSLMYNLADGPFRGESLSCLVGKV